MKEFMRTLKETFQVNRIEPIQYGLLPIAGAILGIVLVLIIMAVDGTGEDYGQLGTVFAIMFSTIVLLFGGIFSVQSDFNLAISMGKTRKYYMPARYLVLVLDTVIILTIVLLTSRIEDALYPAIYPGTVCDLNAGRFLNSPGVFAAIALGVPMIILLFGVLLMRFSAKFFWVVWALWMFLCMGGPRIASATIENPDSLPGKVGLALVEVLTGLTALKLFGIAAVTILTGLIVTFVLFKKQRVTA